MNSNVVHSLIALCLLAGPWTAQAATPKACDLLDVPTATALLGTPVGPQVDKGGAACSYSAKSGNATVALAIVPAPDKDEVQAVEAMQVMASQGKGVTTKSIPGLGEQSFLATRTSDKNFMMVAYHQMTITLGVQRPMTPELEKAMLQTVRQVMAKL